MDRSPSRGPRLERFEPADEDHAASITMPST
jgi:hypothetical protein